MKNKLDLDIYISLLIFTVIGWFFYLTVKLPSAAATLPKLILGLMAVLNTNVLIKGIKNTKATAAAVASGDEVKPRSITWKEVKLPLTVYLFIIGYVILFSTVGYFIATPILFVALMLFFKAGSWKTIFPITVVFMALIYIVFVWQLRVPLI